MIRNSVFPALLLAAGILAATAVSLLSSTSLAWALAGPAILMGTIVAAVAMVERAVSGRAMILGGGVFLACAIVAFADASSVPMMMPILGACAGVALVPKRCVARAHGASEGR